MKHQDSCAPAHAVAVQFALGSQANGLHVPHCTSTHQPALSHCKGETAQVVMELLDIDK